jgi:hypothetical protein
MTSRVAGIARGCPALGAMQRVGIAPLLPARPLLGARTARLCSLKAQASKGFGRGGARPVSGSGGSGRGAGAVRGLGDAHRRFLSTRPLEAADAHTDDVEHAGTDGMPGRLPPPQRNDDDDDDDAGTKQKVKYRKIRQPNSPFRSNEPQALAALNIKTPEDLEQQMQ